MEQTERKRWFVKAWRIGPMTYESPLDRLERHRQSQEPFEALPTRYFIDNAGDGWYLVPEEKREDWAVDDPEILRLKGHPNTVTFELPLEFNDVS